MPLIRTFLPEPLAARAARFGIQLDRLSVSYAQEAIHRKPALKVPVEYNRSSISAALNALLRRPIFRCDHAARTKVSVRAQMDRLKKALMIDASSLKVVQMAGSKGKGSTCKFVESLLRQGFGVKTALFTSPHLISLTERFQVSGTPIDKEVLLRNFWWCWDRLRAEGILFDHADFPSFFSFMTLLAIRIFLEQKVEIAILEVGIGGRLDATTAVIDNLVACGVSVLDYDHVSMLGNTLTEIAVEKAGVMRPGIPCFVAKQREEGLCELLRQGECVGAHVLTIESLRTTLPRYQDITLGIHGSFQYENAAVARAIVLQLLADGHACFSGQDALKLPRDFFQDCVFEDRIAQSLANTRWPGRCQVLRATLPDGHTVTFGIDGAHTPLSLGCCGEWFRERVVSPQIEGGGTTQNQQGVGLVFNCGHERSPVLLLQALLDGCGGSPDFFSNIFFCPADSKKVMSDKAALALHHEAVEAVREHFKSEHEGAIDTFDYNVAATELGVSIEPNCPEALSLALQWSLLLANVWARLTYAKAAALKRPVRPPTITVCRCFADACAQFGAGSAAVDAGRCRPSSTVLVTGSLYLVGTAIQYAQSLGVDDDGRV